MSWSSGVASAVVMSLNVLRSSTHKPIPGLRRVARVQPGAHTAHLLDDGRVLVIGGWSTWKDWALPVDGDAMLYDPRQLMDSHRTDGKPRSSGQLCGSPTDVCWWRVACPMQTRLP